MKTIIISIEGDYGELQDITAEETYEILKDLGIGKINGIVFLGLDFLTEIRDENVVFKKIGKKREKIFNFLNILSGGLTINPIFTSDDGC